MGALGGELGVELSEAFVLVSTALAIGGDDTPDCCPGACEGFGGKNPARSVGLLSLKKVNQYFAYAVNMENSTNFCILSLFQICTF